MVAQSVVTKIPSWSSITATVVLDKKTAMGTTHSLQGGSTALLFLQGKFVAVIKPRIGERLSPLTRTET